MRDVDLTLSPGDRLALTGPSGSGKSTVVAALLRILKPSSGAVPADLDPPSRTTWPRSSWQRRARRTALIVTHRPEQTSACPNCGSTGARPKPGHRVTIERMSMAIVAAAAFIWLGMVVAISFLEAPLKFRAPGVSVRIGLGIGRLVFAALNRFELALLLVVAGALLAGPRPVPVLVAATVTAALLAVQLGVVRPVLTRRSHRVLAGEELPRSRAHVYYVALELSKVLALVALGVAALSGVPA